jgi:hypothetical protein
MLPALQPPIGSPLYGGTGTGTGARQGAPLLEGARDERRGVERAKGVVTACLPHGAACIFATRPTSRSLLNLQK